MSVPTPLPLHPALLSAPALLASLLFLKHGTHSFSPGPLHLLCPLPKLLFHKYLYGQSF